ncbi:hypothetical protein PspS04_09280 [Pseudomonas sp. S04]|nr:hypothetical protein PspS04_09280 [Pseudomonas sp. S04]QHF33038.1 hypothetical protein PspS19_09280 [Pseudomonas sp. S19]
MMKSSPDTRWACGTTGVDDDQTRGETCGSGLARDEAGTFNIDVGRPTAIAGEPAPTVDRGRTHICIPPMPRWERACPR